MFVPLSHAPGHAQCDFGEARVIIGGVERKAHYLVLDLPHSDCCFVKAYPAETTEAFLDGHVSAFASLGGVPQSILYDNTKLAVAGYEGPTGSYTLSVTDITDTSTSIPADDYEGKGFANWQGFDGPFDGTSNGDELVGNLAPGLPATAPVYETDYELFRLSVLPGRNYRVEVRLPETTGGEPADVDVRLLLGLHPYSDIGRADPEDIVVRHVTDEKDIPGDPSLEFTGTRTWYFSARGFVETVVPSRWLASVDILSGEYFEPGDVYTIVLTDITDSGDDYLGAEETTGAVTVGGSVTGNLEVDNDVDSFRVRLEADKSYRIRMRGSESEGGTLADPYVSIVATSPLTQTEFGFGTPINFNNDRSETEKDSELVVTVYSSKDYLILAASPGTGTGTYTIEVEEATTSMGQRANSPATGGRAEELCVRPLFQEIPGDLLPTCCSRRYPSLRVQEGSIQESDRAPGEPDIHRPEAEGGRIGR